MNRTIIGSGRLLCLMIVSLAFARVHAQVTIDKRITVQPIQVRSTDGTTSVSNPSLILYEAETDRIWSQAGIDILFLPTVTYNNSLFLGVASSTAAVGVNNELVDLRATSGQSWSTTALGGTIGDSVIRLFFVQLIDGSTSNLGYTLQSSVNPGVGGSIVYTSTQVFAAIADNAFTINRIDVIAHELGHALSLDHATLGSGGTLNLMSSPRTSPSFISDIYPNGADADQLTGAITGGNPDWNIEQIDRARIMPQVQSITPYIYNNAIPEPSTAAVFAGSVMLVLAGFIRRQRARRL